MPVEEVEVGESSSGCVATPAPAKVTVFVGNNGAGKTSLLKSLATSLSWFVARLRSEKGIGSPIPEEVILNGAPSAAIELKIDDQGRSWEWTLAKVRTGRKAKHSSQLNEVSRLADQYRHDLTTNEQANLPLIAFYPVERAVLDIPLKIRGKHNFLQLDGYDNSLNQGVDFRRFFEWFREREDVENEIAVKVIGKKSKELKAALANAETAPERLRNLEVGNIGALFGEISKLRAALSLVQEVEIVSKDVQLLAVRQAIEHFMPGFKNLQVRRKPRLHMSIDKNGQTLDVLQLSQGEKSLMALVGDIARRLAMMNPALKDPLQGKGIVLIDEVDMHLHPSWQRNIIERLTTAFPNCQFVLTTHSPLVVSDSKNLLVYALNNGELTRVPSQYGQDVNMVLLDVMDTHIRNATVASRLNDLRDKIEDGELAAAQDLLTLLETELPAQNLELVKARLWLRKESRKHASNH